jgi:uncharacterized protein YndB with AHSA1/START domain
MREAACRGHNFGVVGYPSGMTELERVIPATPDDVWGVLSDGWLYAGWVVGATRIRDVDETWPDQGSRIHHSIGVWPAVLDDSTLVLESTPARHLVLQARGWPLGEARVDLRLTPTAGGTRVVMREEPTHGPGVVLPGPLRDPILKIRNRESLQRLAFLAQGRGR